MIISARNRLPVLTIGCTAVLLIGYPLVSHSVAAGDVIVVLLGVPLILFAWQWGARAGLLSAAAGIIYVSSVLTVQYFLIRHSPLDSFWILAVLKMSTGYLVIGWAVGRLSDNQRELKKMAGIKDLAERQARKAELRYKELFDMCPQGIAVVQDMKFNFCNAEVIRSTGYTEDELLGAPLASIHPPGDRQNLSDLFERVLSGNGRLENTTVQVEHKNGERRWLELFARKIAWENRPAMLMLSRDITETMLAKDALRHSNAHLEAILRAVPDIVIEVDREGRYYSVMTSHPDQLIVPPDVHLGRKIHDVMPAEAADIVMRSIEKAAETGVDTGAVYKRVINGQERWRELSTSVIGDPRSIDARFILVVHDCTARKRIEEQLIQSQKMEAVGRLAGGIAHDFNNLLIVVLAFADLIHERIDDKEEVLKDIGAIRESAERAASLTRQLLSFARKTMVQPVVRDLNEFLRDSEKMLKPLLGEDITLSISTEKSPSWVHVDPGQLQQVVLNLAANARDAMAEGGKLSIDVENREIGAGSVGVPGEISPGSYAVMAVSDNGRGMSRDTLSHVFEPFFTTKEVGKGTGLGLSIVYGIAKQFGGAVSVESQEGDGTTFSVYLPLIGSVNKEEAAGSVMSVRGTETILVAEDETAVRTLIAGSLRSCGYTVLEAGSGEEAIRIGEAGRGSVDLVLTDMVMPGMKGGHLAQRMKALFPLARVVFMSGYTDGFGELSGLLGAEPAFIRKPFRMRELEELIRKTLDEDAARPATPSGPTAGHSA